MKQWSYPFFSQGRFPKGFEAISSLRSKDSLFRLKGTETEKASQEINDQL